MRILTSRLRGLPSGPVSEATLDRLYAFPRARWVRANFVSTLDGAAQGSDGLSGSINTAADRRVFAANRKAADCVLVGAGTARAENYRPSRTPLVVVSRQGRLPRGLGGSGTRIVLATCAASGRRPSDEVWVHGDDSVDLAAVVGRCASERMPRVLAEGGPHLFGDLLAADLVDELALTLAPTLAGGDPLRVVAPGGTLGRATEVRHVLEEDSSLLTLWRIRR